MAGDRSIGPLCPFHISSRPDTPAVIIDVKTTHRFLWGSADRVPADDESVHLVVTSPPYPMIAMWDEMFFTDRVKRRIEEGFLEGAFLETHKLLNRVWCECSRVLVEGGFLCVNIGDATRSLNGEFRLYPNHAQIIRFMTEKLGFVLLPGILWHKPSNAPSKFMGSGTLPIGAYVTHEHEHILVFRKRSPRKLSSEERTRRSMSSCFWEERNVWYSDLWNLKGTTQKLGGARARSASFPFEIPFRLINMFSIYGDTVFDPFVGTGTTMAAALASGRNSIGVDVIDVSDVVEGRLRRGVQIGRKTAQGRLQNHIDFVDERLGQGKKVRHTSSEYGFLVVSKQEVGTQIIQPIEYQEGMCLHEVARVDNTPCKMFSSE